MEQALSYSESEEQKVSDFLNVWLLQIERPDETRALDWLREQPEVTAAQFNFIIEERNSPPVNIIPDDPYFTQQWQYLNSGANGGAPDADLDADLAWDITTGGLTPAGDTIVVAVIDGGIDLDHPDLAPNLWKNHAEIPGDLIDNDNNGYVDDYRGWNVWEGNDDIAGSSGGHGTPVSAIIGAKGNNGTGVTGVNWNTKIMFVAGGGTQANILSAYDYVLQSRRQYNITGGQSGAFIVAVNCSWGTNYGQPSDAPLWCAALDSLGQEGILSICATANLPIDVDIAGDLPTTCPGDYLVAVTSLNNADLKATGAAWGLTNVDLGAYGQGVFTAGAGNSYGSVSGTSFAAPQVSGAVGLLYSAPCPNLIALAKTNPGAAALWAKNLLLNSATPNASLQNITVTGGRLNLYSLLRNYEDQCSPCPPPFALYATNISTGSALLKWSEIADFQSVSLRWRESGSTGWNIAGSVENEFVLENLQACTEYEFALMADCGGGTASDWSVPVAFKTDGCCEPPSIISASWIGNTTAALAWSPVTAANGYRLRIRPVGGAWQSYDSGVPYFTVQNLNSCVDYEAAVQTLCDTGATIWSSIFSFKTTGCGSCTDAVYCPAKATAADDEWIVSVAIGNWIHESGAGGDGYQDFTDISNDVLQLAPEQPVDVTITPGFQSFTYKEYFRVFIDFNMDGDFDDADEMAFGPAWASENPVSGQIIPPNYSTPGLTRMRVMMKYKSPGSIAPSPCETFEFGQVEDYCVELLAGPVSTRGSGRQDLQLHLYPQPARDEVWVELPHEIQGEWNLTVADALGKTVLSERKTLRHSAFFIYTKDWKSGVYVIQARQNDVILRGKLLKH